MLSVFLCGCLLEYIESGAEAASYDPRSAFSLESAYQLNAQNSNCRRFLEPRVTIDWWRVASQEMIVLTRHNYDANCLTLPSLRWSTESPSTTATPSPAWSVPNFFAPKLWFENNIRSFANVFNSVLYVLWYSNTRKISFIQLYSNSTYHI